jgi:hypothetical protein
MEQPTTGLRLGFPNGHFYSPIVSADDVSDRTWRRAKECAGVDFQGERQREFVDLALRRWLPVYRSRFVRPPSDTQFSHDNPAFSWLDAPTLFTMLNEHQPKRVIEVGSGYSSMLTAETNTAYLGSTVELTCIEPYPKPWLHGLAGMSRLIESRVQDVPLDIFTRLEAGDILFIDSSHVSKTGSDVNHLIFNVLPSLNAGVLIHFHDIFLPNEYPKEWVLDFGRSWNEQYLVRALLMGSNQFEVEFGCAYAVENLTDLLKGVLEEGPYGGGSLWIRKTP